MGKTVLNPLDILFYWLMAYYKKVDEIEKTGAPEYSVIIAIALSFSLNIIAIDIVFGFKVLKSAIEMVSFYVLTILILYLYFIRSKRYLRIESYYHIDADIGTLRIKLEKSSVIIYVIGSIIAVFL